MLLKNFIGILIILLNIAGIGFLIYLLVKVVKKQFLSETSTQGQTAAAPVKKAKIVNDDIIPDEDDLLKDMDLSDLDNLNLDDFD